MVIQSAVPLRISVAVDDATGEAISIDARIGWLLDLVEQLSTELMQSLWQPATFAALHGGVDGLGRRLPSTAAAAAARLGWVPTPPIGVYVPSRVVRLAQANVVPVLRTIAFRDALIGPVIAALDEHGRLDRRRLGQDRARYVPSAFLRNLCRQLSHPRGAVVTSIVQIQNQPTVARIARLGAADGQLVELNAADPAGVWLRIKLPTSAAPTGRGEWSWCRLWCPLPPHLKERDIACWHLPTLSVQRGRPLLRFTISEIVPDPATAAAAAALGIDWCPSSLGSATVVVECAGQLFTDAATHVYNDRGLGIKLARLQAEGQALTGKIARLTKLAANAAEPTRAQLTAKIETLHDNRRALGAKRRRINRDMAFDFAVTMTTMATTSGAGVIAVEDLRDLESTGRGRANNNRAAQSARRRAVVALEHTAARAGLEVVMCPPRGTSANCSSCDQELTRPGGYHTATCERCGIRGANRDQIAGQNIAKRVLLAKAKVKRPKGKPKRVTTVEHQPVRKTRRKTTATPKQRRHKRVRRTIPRPLVATRPPSPSFVPARAASVWDRDQQPATTAASTSAQPIPDTGDTHVSANVRDR
ncbi:transposase [Mycolicibacterium boenickei]|uniref:Transposase n=1 Tax=Mycolicibacterium boenickei TaxID=146017 RepID=A0AAX2ZVC8_9MYCO|nr:zinc ribbon domain-containing protein [Mycolicibacterium boenickei]PEG59661.1 transposase [Mycolicibacterium boenickei]UNB99269.1 transposase [Mycolicibacterium boenickei]BBX88892.1 hypothetical protein MBOE_05410 [Mycolicibacterium boenickei]